MRAPPLLALTLLLPTGVAAVSGATPGLPAGPLPIGTGPVDFPALHNVVRLSANLYSGGVPEGDAGFLALTRLEIKTVITVDGARPDAARARRFGMRYVHIPFGYDGCPSPTANRLVKAVRDLPGPVYIHCHHGKHRSPAAAAFVRIALDGLPGELATREMERAGTGRNYGGLYADVRAYRPPSSQLLDGLPAGFPEIAPTPRLVEAMVMIEQRFEKLLRFQREGWKAMPGDDHAHEALQLHELYTELNRTDEVRRRPGDFRAWVTRGEVDGKALESYLRTGKLEMAAAALGRLAASCGACHAKYRNIPQPSGRATRP